MVAQGTAVLTGSFVLYVALKFVMAKGLRVPGTSFSFANFYALLHLLTFVIIGTGFLISTGSGLMQRIGRTPRVALAISLVGGLTLEIYLVHVYVLRSEMVRVITFPLNVAVFFSLTLVLSWLFAFAANRLRQYFQNAWMLATNDGVR
jgi:membrane-bound acyltransferase YfiQ involved in biofilm formation